MATTPTYSWPIPDDTDLVKDGAEAIRDLGNAIDTTVGGLGSGLVHINRTSFSAVSAVNFNNVFSATYDNYKIMIRATSLTSFVAFNFRMRNAGTDDTTSNYNNVYIHMTSSVSGIRAATGTLARFASVSNLQSTTTIDIFRPFEAAPTQLFAATNQATTSSIGIGIEAASHDVSSSFDGITFSCSETITGVIDIFGYSKG